MINMEGVPGYSAVAQERMKLRSHSLGIQPTPLYRLGDAVGALDNRGHPHYGRIEKIDFDRGMHWVRESDGSLFGPCPARDLFFDATAHVPYPHYPGTLHDCPGCEVLMAQAEGDCPDCGAEVTLDCKCEENPDAE